MTRFDIGKNSQANFDFNVYYRFTRNLHFFHYILLLIYMAEQTANEISTYTVILVNTLPLSTIWIPGNRNTVNTTTVVPRIALPLYYGKLISVDPISTLYDSIMLSYTVEISTLYDTIELDSTVIHAVDKYALKSNVIDTTVFASTLIDTQFGCIN